MLPVWRLFFWKIKIPVKIAMQPIAALPPSFQEANASETQYGVCLAVEFRAPHKLSSSDIFSDICISASGWNYFKFLIFEHPVT
jgi:hypothetical protein